MIRTILFRDRDCGQPNQQRFNQGTFEESPTAALRRLVSFDLRFGANVSHISPTELHLQSSCMDLIDTTEFSGSEDEMAPLFAAIRLCQEQCSSTFFIPDNLGELLNHLPHGTAADPGFRLLISPFAMRENNLALCLLLPSGITHPDDIACALNMRFDEFLAVFDLMQEFDNTSFREVAAACGNN
ncbi:MAG: hypothetical protein K2W82_15655 [Candidatus Obscuribacterales bacterium]|nr:hypothetical protein [Candidatus Obscuribacterales bacterium]